MLPLPDTFVEDILHADTQRLNLSVHACIAQKYTADNIRIHCDGRKGKSMEGAN